MILPKVISREKRLGNFEDPLLCPVEALRNLVLWATSEPLHLTLYYKIFMKKCLVKVCLQRSQSNIVSGYPLNLSSPVLRVKSLFMLRYWSLSLEKNHLKIPQVTSSLPTHQTWVSGTMCKGNWAWCYSGRINTEFWNTAHSEGSPCTFQSSHHQWLHAAHRHRDDVRNSSVGLGKFPHE